MEIEEQNAMNILEIKKKQGELIIIKKNDGWEEKEEEVAKAKEISKLITILKGSTTKNNLKKEITSLQIMESMNNTKKIRDEIFKKIKTKENREVLEIIIKNHVLELQNIELEINMQIQERMISDMKQIVTSQKQLIKEHGIELPNSMVANEEEMILNEEDILDIEEDFMEEDGEQNNENNSDED